MEAEPIIAVVGVASLLAVLVLAYFVQSKDDRRKPLDDWNQRRRQVSAGLGIVLAIIGVGVLLAVGAKLVL